MRLLSARLIVSLIIGVTLVSLSSSYYEVLVQKQSLRRDLQRRAEVLGESLARNVERELDRDSIQALQRTVQRFGNREHLLGLAVYDRQGRLIAITKDLAPLMPTAPPVMSQALNENHGVDVFQRLGTASVNIYALPLHRQEDVRGVLAIVHDAGYIKDQSLRIWRETFLSALAHVFLIVLITLLIVRWSIAGPIARTAQWMRALRTGRASSTRIKVPDMELFPPLAREVATFAETPDHRPDLPRKPRLGYARRDNPSGRPTGSPFIFASRLGDGRLFCRLQSSSPICTPGVANSLEVKRSAQWTW